MTGAILDASMLNFNTTIELGASERGLPIAVLALAKHVPSLRFGIHLGKLNYLKRVNELEVPILLFHGDGDDTFPSGRADALANARPGIVGYVRITGAPHVGSWNVNRAVCEATVSDFIRRVASRPVRPTGIVVP